MAEPILATQIGDRKPDYVGKVRDVYEFGDELAVVTTDRISAFDVVMGQGIPHKGRVLHGLTKWWMENLKSAHQIVTDDLHKMPAWFYKQPEIFAGRTMLVKKLKIIPIEYVVRKFLCGSGWKEYKYTGRLGGMPQPKGLQLNMPLAGMTLTPTTKASPPEHDAPISVADMLPVVFKFMFNREFEEGADAAVAGSVVTQTTRAAFTMFRAAAELLWQKGILLADTKFEFGLDYREGRKNPLILLADECFTPDSSRLWEFDQYRLGQPIHSLDKQGLRDYLEAIHWNKKEPAPVLPPELVQEIELTYLSLYERIVGKPLEGV